MIPVIIPVTQFRSRERRKLHFRESNFPGGMPRDPLEVRTSSTQRSRRCSPPAEPLLPVLSNATENPEGVNFFLL